MAESFARLRELLHRPPSFETWDALLELLEGWPEPSFSVALEYAAQHLAPWPHGERAWSDLQKLPRAWPLIRRVNLPSHQLHELPSLRQHHQITSLHLSRCQALSDAALFKDLGHLRSLSLVNCRFLVDIDELVGCSGLEELSFNCCSELKDAEVLGDLRELRLLNLSGCTALESVGFLRHLKKLEVLYVQNLPLLEELELLSDLTQLRELDLMGCRNLRCARGLAELPRLSSLKLGVYTSYSKAPLPLLEPQPQALWMETRAQVEAYQQRLLGG